MEMDKEIIEKLVKDNKPQLAPLLKYVDWLKENNGKSVLPVIVSAVVAIPIAYTVIGRWLEGYVIRTDNSPLIYIGAFAVVLAVTLAAVALQALSLMRTNPAEALKKE